MSQTWNVREATPADIDIVMHHRRSMFYDMGFRDDDSLDAMAATSKPYLLTGLMRRSYRSWFIEEATGMVVAGGGIIITDHHSSPGDPLPQRAIIANVYTEPEFRRRGLARMLMETMVAWCRNEGFRTVYLHASDEGRYMYETMGFTPTNEMRLVLQGCPVQSTIHNRQSTIDNQLPLVDCGLTIVD